MEQLTQNLKDGHMQLLEVPFPVLGPGQILVRNHFSLISAGTEGKTVKDARLGYIGKARARKEEVKKVIQTAKTIGWMETYRLVMNKLDAPSALGYSCAGEVIAVAEDVHEFRIGDKVACGGSTAVHAEVVAIPVNLAVKLKESLPMDEAAFTTLGAIAMQGVRQADLRLGETCVVIGLGLLGQITCQLLKASGVTPIGIDIDSRQVEQAKKHSCEIAFERSNEQLEQAVLNLTNGQGADAIIITAATSSNDPIDLAGTLCRKKGSVVIVGAVPTGFQRKNYYTKELQLKMSCSYGPGRYDAGYEEQGNDYPYAYVRWTENRNMQAFADLMASSKIQIKPLITHTFPFSEAKNAYDLILKKTEPFSGIVLQYDVEKTVSSRLALKNHPHLQTTAKVGMIGAGSFGQNFLLPALKGKVTLTGIATARPNNARNVADKFGFSYCSGDASEIIADPDTNTIFIATRHDLHAEFVKAAIQNGKNVFTEKPLCLFSHELEEIKSAWEKNPVHLMVGFNRRFAPLTKKLKEQLNHMVPVSIHYRINAGIVPKEHWIHDPKTGGGRIVGEVCHFIDYCSYLAGSPVESISAYAMRDPSSLNDTVSINMSMQNGSIGTISYFSNGNKDLSKEYIEIFNGGTIGVIDDFKELTIYGPKGKRTIKGVQDKGHKAEVDAFIHAINKGLQCPIPFEEIYNTTLFTFKAIESVLSAGEKKEST